MKQWYIFEMNGFTEEEAQELLRQAFHDIEWGKNQGMAFSHLTEKGIANLKRHVLKQEVTE